MRVHVFGTALLCSTLLYASPAFAVNGTQLTGYGTKAAGMGGAAIALPQDAIAAANNPAGMAFVGNRVDGDLVLLYVRSKTSFAGTPHKGNAFAGFPEIGYNRELNSKITLGVSTSASGADFRYKDSLFPGAVNGRTSGMLLSVAVLPTVTYKPTERLSVGASFAGGFQMFHLSNFAGVQNRGWNSAFGAGWRIGAMWRPTNFLSVGASYASKVDFGSFKGYAHDLLAATNGHVDVPAKAGVGIAIKPTSKLTLAGDYQHIAWSKTQFKTLFGYRDQNVWRGGAAYDITPEWTVRAGASFARRQFPSDYVVPNILLVGINSKSITAGATRKFDNGSEISISADDNYGGRYDGTGPSTGSSIKTHFYVVSVGWGKRF